MNDRQASCEGKQRYITRALAKHASKRCARDGIKHLTPYPCDYCWQWHLGHRIGEATYLRRGGLPVNELGGLPGLELPPQERTSASAAARTPSASW